jgi:hypothetical protein
MTAHWSSRVIICAFALLAFATTRRAQEARPYVGGTFIVSTLKLGTFGSGSTGYSNTSIDTWLKGLTIEAGAAINPRLSVGVEFTPPSQEVRFDQQYGYVFSQGYKAMIRYREGALFGVARLNFPQVPYVQLALVGGGGRVLGHATGRTAAALRFPASG